MADVLGLADFSEPLIDDRHCPRFELTGRLEPHNGQFRNAAFLRRYEYRLADDHSVLLVHDQRQILEAEARCYSSITIHI